MRDLYKVALEIFADPREVAFYVISIFVLGFHMWQGWNKSVFKMKDVPGNYKKLVLLLGQGLAVIITMGFISSPLYVHFVLLKGSS